MSDDRVLASLRAAVDAAPADDPLKLHLAGLLLEAGHVGEALRMIGTVLEADPSSSEARALMGRVAVPTVGSADATPPGIRLGEGRDGARRCRGSHVRR